MNRRIGRDHEAPLPFAVAERPGQVCRAGLQFRRVQRPRRKRRQRESHGAGGHTAVVDRVHRHVRVLPAWVHQAQHASLPGVGCRVEDRNEVAAGSPPRRRDGTSPQVVEPFVRRVPRCRVVHAGDEPVRGADVGQDVVVGGGVDVQAVTGRQADRRTKTLARVARHEVVGVEVPGIPRAQQQAGRTSVLPRRVDPRPVGSVLSRLGFSNDRRYDTDEALPEPVRRGKKRHAPAAAGYADASFPYGGDVDGTCGRIDRVGPQTHATQGRRFASQRADIGDGVAAQVQGLQARHARC